MRNRQKAGPVRPSLLAALDVEYARASKARDLDRMAEISAIMAALKESPEPVPVPEQTPLAETAQAKFGSASLVLDGKEDYVMASAPDFEVQADLPPAPGQSFIQDFLARVGDPPAWTDLERQTAAKQRIRDAVHETNKITDNEQLRYELALLVVNDNVEALQDMQELATVSGLPIKQYAQRVIGAHNARRRRAAQIYAIEAQALKDIDVAAGDDIERLADKAIRDIQGDK